MSDRAKRIKDPRAFGAYLRENFIMLTRTRAEVGRELPPVTKIPHLIESDTKALDQIKDSAGELARLIMAGTESFRGQQMQAREQLSNMLRQATGIAKAPYVADFVRLLNSSGQPIVLAGWHRAVYEIWKSKLHDLRVVMYTGSESPKQKDEAARAMKAGEVDVFIISLRSGAGLDGLQYSACSTIVIGELDWAPAVHEQLIGRLLRDGQTKNVLAYFMLSEYGADPVMSTVLGIKREQLEGIRSPTAPLVERLESIDPQYIKKLASDYLLRHGKKSLS